MIFSNKIIKYFVHLRRANVIDKAFVVSYDGCDMLCEAYNESDMGRKLKLIESVWIPLVLCDVIGTHAVVLLSAAMQFKVVLPVRCAW